MPVFEIKFRNLITGELYTVQVEGVENCEGVADTIREAWQVMDLVGMARIR